MNLDRRDEYNFQNIWIYRNIKKNNKFIPLKSQLIP